MKSETLRDRGFLARGSAKILLVNSGGKFLALAVTGLLAAVLGASGFGIYSAAISWVTVISMFAGLGFPVLLLREMSTGLADQDWGRMRGILRFAGLCVLGASLACALLGALIAWLSFDSSEESTLRTSIVLAMVLVPLRAFAKLRNGSLQGLRFVVYAQLPEQCIRPAGMLLLIALWAIALGWQVDPLVALSLQIVASVASVAFGTAWLWRSAPSQLWSVQPVIRARAWASSATHMLLFSSMTVLLAQSGILVMAFLAEESEVGIFALSVRLSEGLLIFLAAVNAPLMPIVARAHAKGETAQMQKYLQLGSLLSMGAAIPVGAAMYFGSEFILGLFGDDFASGAQVFRLLILAQVLNTAFGPVGLLLNVSGHERAAAIGLSAAAVANVSLCLLLVPTWGAEGAAWAMLFSTLTWNVWLAVLARRRLGVFAGLLSLTASAR